MLISSSSGTVTNLDYRQVEWRVVGELLRAHTARDGATLTSLYIDPAWALPGLELVLTGTTPRRVVVVDRPLSATALAVHPDLRNRRERRRDRALRRRS